MPDSPKPINLKVPQPSDEKLDDANRDEQLFGKMRVPMPRKTSTARRKKNTFNSSQYIHTRILWPALGFPGVVAPQAGGDSVDPTRGINLLILCETDRLYPADVARHLRWVPWDQRHTRHLDSAEKGGGNAFAAQDISVYDPAISKAGELVKLVRFADDRGGQNGFAVGVANFVLKFYKSGYKAVNGKKVKLRYLHHIRISESASAKLPVGALYNLFWINPDKNDTAEERAAEMHPLVEKFGKDSRFGNDNVREYDDLAGDKAAPRVADQLLGEYEYDFRRNRSSANRTEVLHPLFVRDAPSTLRIGHLTDTHYSIRADKYEFNLKKAGKKTAKYSDYNNWNRTSNKLYDMAKQSSDVLLMTGDLIDYGRGVADVESDDGRAFMGSDRVYWRDRNWFLFYDALANGGNYQKPVYTTLGNHDWRFNPYAPSSPGAPDPKVLNLDKQKKEVQTAHGEGHDAGRMYPSTGFTEFTTFVWQKWKKRDGRIEVGGSPLETVEESVAWYLLLINPCLDYSFSLPGGYDILMLDWAEDEIVDKHEYDRGMDKGRTYTLPNVSGSPVAKDAISDEQATLVTHFTQAKGKAKVLGIHEPVVNPWGHWYDDGLKRGTVRLPQNKKLKKGTHLQVSTTGPNGTSVTEKYTDHPALAVRHRDYEPFAQVADDGCVNQRRPWLINTLRKAGVQLVLAGHIHRRTLLALEEQPDGALVVKLVDENKIAAAPSFPLFVNTTSAGPRGSVKPYKEGKRLLESAYAEIGLTSSGRVIGITHKTVSGATSGTAVQLTDETLMQVMRMF